MINKNISLGIIVQARTGSTRLPGKVIMNFDNGRTILDIILSKFDEDYFDNYPKILATSDSPSDDILQKWALSHKFQFFRGSENDVLERFIKAAEMANLTHVLRICADNPFLNQTEIKLLIDELEKRNTEIDYISFVNDKNVPVIKTHFGMFAEIVSIRALKSAYETSAQAFYHEHVTNYIYEHSDKFNLVLIPAHRSIIKRDDIRLTVDDIEDFELVSDLYSKSILFSDDIPKLVDFIDRNEAGRYRKIMIKNIKKYKK